MGPAEARHGLWHHRHSRMCVRTSSTFIKGGVVSSSVSKPAFALNKTIYISLANQKKSAEKFDSKVPCAVVKNEEDCFLFRKYGADFVLRKARDESNWALFFFFKTESY